MIHIYDVNWKNVVILLCRLSLIHIQNLFEFIRLFPGVISGEMFLDLLVRFPGLVPLHSLDLSFAQRHLICLFAFKLLPCTADNLTISNYLHC